MPRGYREDTEGMQSASALARDDPGMLAGLTRGPLLAALGENLDRVL